MESKIKKIFSAVLASSMILSAIPSINVSAASTSMPSGTKWGNGQRYIKLTENINLSSRWVVSDNDRVYLDLNGYTISRSLDDSSRTGEVISVKNGGELIINDTSTAKTGMITGGYDYSGGGGIHISNGTVILENGKICGNKSVDGGGGVQLDDDKNSKFIMKGGEICHNKTEDNYHGGGVYVYYGSFTMSGGSIHHNEASYGGGIYANYGAGTPFSMTGGEIRDNTARNSGGGIYVNDGRVMIAGGSEKVKICNNKASGYGGGIYCDDDDGTKVSNAYFSGNTAKQDGGAIYIDTDYTEFSNITVENNTATKGGGMYIDSNNITTISGEMIVRNNSGLNVYEADSERLKLSGPISSNSDMGVYVSGEEGTAITQTISNSILKAMGGVDMFVSDRSGYQFVSEDNKIKLAKGTTDKTGVIPTQFLADNNQSYRLIRGVFSHPSHNDHSTDLDAVYYYSDGYFMNDAKKYNDHLATMSICLAMAAFNSNLGGEDYTNKSANIKKLYNDIGYKNTEVNEGFKVKPSRKTIGIALANKELSDGTPLIAIALRGTNYDGEWASNVSIGDKGEAIGFGDATQQTMDFLAEYIEKYNIDSSKAKFWVTGYSRTGAVSNMVAKRLIDTYNNDGTKVFAYCNAPANGGLSSEMKSGCDYSGIHNIINPSDIVPYVAPAEMGFIRYGTDHFMPGNAAKTTLDKKQIGASLARDNTSYSVGTTNYNNQKNEMLVQLAAVEPDMVFSDKFKKATINFFPSTKIKERSSSVTAEEWLPDFMKFVCNNVLAKAADGMNARQYYTNNTVSAGSTGNITLQEALARAMELWRSDLSNDDFNELMTVVNNLMVGVGDISWTDKSDIYDNLIGEYDLLNEGQKIYYINLVNKLLNDAGYRDMNISTANREKIDSILPVMLDFALYLESIDYREADQDYLGTLANNVNTIALAHVPVINYAWLRSYDSYYDNNMLPAKGEVVETAPAAPTSSISEKDEAYTEELTVELSSTDGAAIYYTLDNSDPSDISNANRQIYSESEKIVLSGEKGQSKTYTIKAYAKGTKGLSSTLSTFKYTVEIPCDLYELTLGEEAPVKYEEQSTVTVDAKTADDKVFVGWTVKHTDTDEELTDDEINALTGFSKQKSVVSFTMPSYNITLIPSFKDKVKSVEITFDVPNDGEAFSTTAEWKADTDAEDAQPRTVALKWFPKKVGGYEYTASVELKKDSESLLEFADEVAVKVNGKTDEADGTIKVERINGNLAVSTNYDLTPAASHTVTVLCYDLNNEVQQDKVVYTYTAGSDVTLTAPSVADEAFNFWTIDDSIITEENQLNDTVTFTMPDEDITVTAAYYPMVHKIDITMDELQAGKKFPNKVNSCSATVTNVNPILADYINVEWQTEDITVGYEKDYTLKLTLTPPENAVMNFIYKLADDIVITVNGAAISKNNIYAENGLSIMYTFPTTDTAKVKNTVNPDIIELANGASVADIKSQLPSMVKVALEDGKTVDNATVEWNDVPSTYDAESKDLQTISITGTVTLPDGYTAAEGFENNVTATVKVKEYSVQLVSIAEIQKISAAQLSDLPTNVDITTSDPNYSPKALITWDFANIGGYVAGTTGETELTLPGIISLPEYVTCEDNSKRSVSVIVVVEIPPEKEIDYTGVNDNVISVPYIENVTKFSLPSKIEIKTTSIGKVYSANVVWNSYSEPQKVTSEESDTDVWLFEASGTITLPDGVKNSANKSLDITKKVYVDVEQKPADKSGFTVTNGGTAAYINNNTGESQTVTVIVADYDAEGNMTEVHLYANEAFAVNEMKNYPIIDTSRVFVWDSIQSMKPILK